ncbi:MAG: alpha/beta fold hydrolase [Gemmatimonadetes bacterium]|nr:alpha/beta fold hydrolase [Gemmatimonadota bacterium]
MRWLAVVVALAGAACSPGRQDPAVFVGEVRGSEVTLPIEVSIDSAGARVTSHLHRLAATPAFLATSADSTVLTAAVDRDTIRFAGPKRGGRWSGIASRGDERAEFAMVELTPRWRERERGAVGTYRTEEGRLLGIDFWSEFGTRPMLVDYSTGRIGPLLAIDGNRFLVGQALVAPVFPADTVVADPDSQGTAAAIEYRSAEGVVRRAARVPTTDSELTFPNGEVSLAGRFTVPAGPGPFPTLVLVHGSNAQTREGFGPWPRYFAGLGYAVLAFDKRGTGRSTGDWKQADFPTLAGDVGAAIRAVAQRPEVRRDRIGLWGISQAGWIMPLVAASMPDTVAFLVVHAGTGTTVREQGILNFRNELRFAGLPDAAVRLGIRYRHLDDSVTLGLVPFERQMAFFEANRDQAPWLDEPAPVDTWFRGYYRMLMDFDPSAAWSRVLVPVLLFFGELDANVPPEESWPPIERALAAAGNRAVTHYLLPSANHVFFEAQTGAGSEYPGLRRFVSGYFDRMAAWLAEVTR